MSDKPQHPEAELARLADGSLSADNRPDRAPSARFGHDSGPATRQRSQRPAAPARRWDPVPILGQSGLGDRRRANRHARRPTDRDRLLQGRRRRRSRLRDRLRARSTCHHRHLTDSPPRALHASPPRPRRAGHLAARRPHLRAGRTPDGLQHAAVPSQRRRWLRGGLGHEPGPPEENEAHRCSPVAPSSPLCSGSALRAPCPHEREPHGLPAARCVPRRRGYLIAFPDGETT
jgi:hypothetical protein